MRRLTLLLLTAVLVATHHAAPQLLHSAEHGGKDAGKGMVVLAAGTCLAVAVAAASWPRLARLVSRLRAAMLLLFAPYVPSVARRFRGGNDPPRIRGGPQAALCVFRC